eukprot:107935-Rhodomonas_salina.1
MQALLWSSVVSRLLFPTRIPPCSGDSCVEKSKREVHFVLWRIAVLAVRGVDGFRWCVLMGVECGAQVEKK